MLMRERAVVKVGGREVRVKIADRPSGPSAKAEADAAIAPGRLAREAVRRSAETLSLKEKQ